MQIVPSLPCEHYLHILRLIILKLIFILFVGDIDAEPLVSNEEKDKPDKAIEDVKDVEETVKEVTKSQVMPVLPDAEKEIVETKYENNMKPGPEIDEHSSFFGYFILLSIVAIIAYLVFHNKQKVSQKRIKHYLFYLNKKLVRS